MSARRTIGLVCLATLTGAAPRGAIPPDTVTALVDVTVVPMDAERTLTNHTVVVRNGVIEAVGPSARVRAPAGAAIVDGRGKYLMPGLADMHTHSVERSDLLLYVAHGVTTVLDHGWAPLGFVSRGRAPIERGEQLAPRVLAGLMVNQPWAGRAGVRTTAEARAVVDSAVRHGYEFVKVYSYLSDSAFFAIVEEARRRGIAVIGHGVCAVGLERQLAAGQALLSHVEEYSNAQAQCGGRRPEPGVAAAMTRRAGAFVVANLSAYEVIGMQWANPPQIDAFLAEADARHIRPELRAQWRRGSYTRLPAAQIDTVHERFTFLERMTGELARAGVPLLTGTDSPQIPGLPPGASITRRARARGERFGTVTPGMRADLLLLAADPLADVANVRRVAGVMVRGRWLEERALRQAVDSMVATYPRAP
jgi:hypothetical protein